MKRKTISQWLAELLAFAVILGCLTITPFIKLTADAASADYPAQLLRISTYDNSLNLNIAGTNDKSAINVQSQSNTLNESWRFDFASTDGKGGTAKIVNQATGRLLPPMNYSVSEGTQAILFGNTNNATQSWTITAAAQKGNRKK